MITTLASKAHGRSQRFVALLGSRRFFTAIMIIFGLQSLWIALTARYPMAFDEQFHFGIINIYTQHLNPFLASQPAGANQFGAVVADPSYLYQYLLSFPLRLIRLFTDNLTLQVLWLRFINVALFGSSLFIFRGIFRLARTSKALTNSLLFCFVLIPVVPLLAAQINYDNLMVPMSALAVYATARFSQRVRSNKTWSWLNLSLIMSICLLASLVKYAFIPIFVAMVVWLALDYRWLRRQQAVPSKSSKSLLRTVACCLLLVVSVTLFAQRYGLNVIRYHTPIPECDQVLSISQCQAYGPWARNYMFGQQHIQLPLNQVVTYPFIWIYHALNELLFSITSRFNASGGVDYYGAPQLIGIEILAWTVFGISVAAVLRYGRQLLGDRTLRFYAIVAAAYIAALGGQNYLDYLHLGFPVAIHGRYLLPILPLLLLIAARAIGLACQLRPQARPSVVSRKALISGFVLLFLLLEGGGFGTYIIRSRADWAWPQSRAAQQANQTAQDIMKPFVINIGS